MHRLAIIGLCAGVGAVVRFALYDGDSLWLLLGINLVGAFVFGLCRTLPEPQHSAITTGFCGGFTSFSAATVVVLSLPLGLYFTYCALTALGCVAAVVSGEKLVAWRQAVRP